MLEGPRRLSADIQLPIKWMQADAAATGLPDRTFDVAFCQQGLQFFDDVGAALHELHRLLVPGDRLAVSAWTGADNPGYAPIRTALEQHLPDHPEAAGFLRAIFGLSDGEKLRELLRQAGFREVRVIRRSDMVHCRSAEAWVEAFLAAAPLKKHRDAGFRDPKADRGRCSRAACPLC